MSRRAGSNVRAIVVILVASQLLLASARSQAQSYGGSEPPTQPPTQVQATPATPAEESLESPRPSAAAVVFDVLLLRPIAVVVVPIGAAAFIPAALMTAPNGMDSVQQALVHFVTDPWKYAFQRPLGEI